MRTLNLAVIAAIGLLVASDARAGAQSAPPDPTQTIIRLERAALDRWGRGDPEGFLGTYAPDVTYFDPFLERRADGAAKLRELYGPIAGKVSVSRYDMIGAKVQHDGNMAVLTYNLVSYVARPNADTLQVRWNSSSVYRRASGQWKMIHSHWSFTKPELKQPVSETVDTIPSADAIVGTWQLVSVKDPATGVVDSVANHADAWVIYAPTHVSFTMMRRQRPGSMSPTAFAALSAVEKAKVQHSWVWDDANAQRFTGLASTWRLSGRTLTFGSELRINPWRVGKEFSETILRLDRTTMVVRTEVTGLLREETLRRIN